MTRALTYIEVDLDFCALRYGETTGAGTCPAVLGVDSEVKCFNSKKTCPVRPSYISSTVTLRFAQDVGFLPASIDCIPSITGISFTPATVSLGKDLGTRASLSVTFRDHPWPDTGPGFDKYRSERDYEPVKQGTFWGRFRARQPYLRGRPIRLIRGVLGQALAEMETRHFVIDSFGHNAADGAYQIVAKDALKLADDDRAQAPVLSQGFLVADIAAAATTLTLSPSGIANAEYPASGHAAIGGKEIVAFSRDPSEGNDADTKLLIHCDGTNGQTTFSDSSAAARTVSRTGNTQVSTAARKFGTGGALFDGTGDSLTCADHADWTPAGDFTVDFWVRFSALSGTHFLFLHATDANNRYFLSVDATGALTFSVVSASATIVTMSSAAGVVVALGAGFYHVAVVRFGTVWSLYVDGVEVATTTNADAIPNFTGLFRIGTDQAGANGLNGVIDEFRFSHVARWTEEGFDLPVNQYETDADLLNITRARFNTVAIDHEGQDRVQLVVVYDAQDVADIIRDLLVNYAGVDDGHIPIETWRTETGSFIDRVFSAVIAEPTGVRTLLSELIESAALSMWWDDVTPQIRLRVLRAIAADAFVFDQGVYLEGSFASREQPNERLSQVWRYYAKRNPLEGHDNPDNYRSCKVTVDLEAETDYGSPAIHKIFDRWIPFGGGFIAEKANALVLSRFRDPPRRFNFATFRNEIIIPELGQGYRVAGMGIQDETGAAISAPMQITRLNPGDGRFEVEAQELVVSGDAVDPVNRVIVIDSDTRNVNLRTLHDSLFPAPTDQDVLDGVNLKCYIDDGVIVGGVGAFGASRSFDVGDGWPAGFPITVVVNGRLQGGGGRGGTPGPGRNGLQGGTALYTRTAISLEYRGSIKAGGGGGGAGAIRFSSSGPTTYKGCGGGGGAGEDEGLGGLGSINGDDGTQADSGDPGTLDAGGAGGSGPGTNAGGAGGDPGMAGSNGSQNLGVTSIEPRGLGGAAGIAIDGISFVTVTVSTGTIVGPQVN